MGVLGVKMLNPKYIKYLKPRTKKLIKREHIVEARKAGRIRLHKSNIAH